MARHSRNDSNSGITRQPLLRFIIVIVITMEPAWLVWRKQKSCKTIWQNTTKVHAVSLRNQRMWLPVGSDVTDGSSHTTAPQSSRCWAESRLLRIHDATSSIHADISRKMTAAEYRRRKGVDGDRFFGCVSWGPPCTAGTKSIQGQGVFIHRRMTWTGRRPLFRQPLFRHV